VYHYRNPFRNEHSKKSREEPMRVPRGFAASEALTLVDEVARIASAAPCRHMVTPGGYTMSVAMCGHLGWVSDRIGYCYTPVDPILQL
jgi:alkylated DNA repair dioxygenase AlkB